MINVKDGKIIVFGGVGELMSDIAILEASIANIKLDIAKDINEPLEAIECDIKLLKEKYMRQKPTITTKDVIDGDDFIITAKEEEDESEN